MKFKDDYMKSILLSILFIFSLSFLMDAAEGDTIKVQSHQETHWDWYGNWFDTTSFPASGEYRRIIMYYTLGCPSGGCSEWDYTTKIEVEDPIDANSSRWVELTRIITPYAGNKGDSWEFVYEIDVTDYAPILNGERRVRAHYSGYQDGFTVSIDFDFIEGTPPREVLDVTTLYDGTFKYGFANDPIEDYLVPTDITMHPELGGAKFRMVASGHSFGGNENCAEFCRKWYKLNVNGNNAVQEDIWRDDCGSNPLEAQTGTWVYDRAGWCPGTETKRFDNNISAFVAAGQTAEFDVDWESYNYNGGAGFDPQYIIEATIFQYGDWNFANDAAIKDVLSPSSKDQYWEMNPVCNNPEIVIENTGSEVITYVNLEYWVEGSPEIIRHTFQGVINPGQSRDVVLPAYDKWLFGEKEKNRFHVQIVGVNNTDDEYDGNNHFVSTFSDTPVFPEEFIIAFNNNAGGSETKYRVEDERGNIVYERTTASSNTNYLDTVTCAPGCYTMFIDDSGCDGLRFFANNDGNGRIWLHSAEEGSFFPPLHQFEDEFGCNAQLSFTVGYTMGDEETMDYPEGIAEWEDGSNLVAYPNPSAGNVTLALQGEIEVGGEIFIYNQTGQMIKKLSLTDLREVQISGLAMGNYIAQYRTDSKLKTVKFTVLY